MHRTGGSPGAQEEEPRHRKSSAGAQRRPRARCGPKKGKSERSESEEGSWAGALVWVFRHECHQGPADG